MIWIMRLSQFALLLFNVLDMCYPFLGTLRCTISQPDNAACVSPSLTNFGWQENTSISNGANEKRTAYENSRFIPKRDCSSFWGSLL